LAKNGPPAPRPQRLDGRNKFPLAPFMLIPYAPHVELVFVIVAARFADTT
jgi:hypothetical protein